MPPVAFRQSLAVAWARRGRLRTNGWVLDHLDVSHTSCCPPESFFVNSGGAAGHSLSALASWRSAPTQFRLRAFLGRGFVFGAQEADVAHRASSSFMKRLIVNGCIWLRLKDREAVTRRGQRAFASPVSGYRVSGRW